VSSATPTLARCCPAHESLEQLTAHLIAEFNDVEPLTVAREVARGVAAARFTGLAGGEDSLRLVEVVARQQLELIAGRRDEEARLDPQAHPRRRRLTLVDAIAREEC
jgi:hypothetical protein